jgi:general L-amino acid transport system permease protein
LEFSALLAGLTFYTGAFIAEIVRAGIQSVSKGQWEAARSLGLQSNLVMRLVVFPQALRVMIPSLNSMYQSLAKNSSLGFAIAFPEIYSVASTTFNQTGRPVEVFVIIAGCYLLLTLTISLLMNQLNRAVQVKER